ncbi:hypothetical protein Goshw_008892 [Gossypium schwendimanii]|uniref:Glutaredoxin domain-containing protein n=1 Tax=Gossypium schwendimanii TaxID=34291 RepID=A0A7J9MAG1_GOSSC|nr:hypothetical protein [Gossypium schwendimanii]
MFPHWLLRSPPNTAASTPKSPSHFSSSSLKDINAILQEDQPFQSYSKSPKKPSIFHRVTLSTSVLRAWAAAAASAAQTHYHAPLSPQPSVTLPYADHRVVLYFTSLRVVRRTFEDCKAVRSILRGFGVPIDERDLSMDSDFVGELQGIIGRNEIKSFTLPLVFIGGKYVGGAEEIKRLHECGELKNLIGGSPVAVGSSVCDSCQGMRFVVCRQCNGSHKIYFEKSGFRSCNDCNANGLVRCPSCSPGHHRVSYSFS